MNPKDISQAKDPDIKSALTALHRASELARKTAIETGTELVVVRDGRLLLIDAKTLKGQDGVETPRAS